MFDSGPKAFDPFKSRLLGTQLRFTWFPEKCEITGKRLWLTNAYRQTAMWTGPDEPVFEHRWYDKNEFLIAKIKGEV